MCTHMYMGTYVYTRKYVRVYIYICLHREKERGYLSPSQYKTIPIDRHP